MPGKRLKAEESVNKLRQADVELARDSTMAAKFEEHRNREERTRRLRFSRRAHPRCSSGNVQRPNGWCPSFAACACTRLHRSACVLYRSGVGTSFTYRTKSSWPAMFSVSMPDVTHGS